MLAEVCNQPLSACFLPFTSEEIIDPETVLKTINSKRRDLFVTCQTDAADNLRCVVLNLSPLEDTCQTIITISAVTRFIEFTISITETSTSFFMSFC